MCFPTQALRQTRPEVEADLCQTSPSLSSSPSPNLMKVEKQEPKNKADGVDMISEQRTEDDRTADVDQQARQAHWSEVGGSESTCDPSCIAQLDEGSTDTILDEDTGILRGSNVCDTQMIETGEARSSDVLDSQSIRTQQENESEDIDDIALEEGVSCKILDKNVNSVMESVGDKTTTDIGDISGDGVLAITVNNNGSTCDKDGATPSSLENMRSSLSQRGSETADTLPSIRSPGSSVPQGDVETMDEVVTAHPRKSPEEVAGNNTEVDRDLPPSAVSIEIEGDSTTADAATAAENADATTADAVTAATNADATTADAAAAKADAATATAKADATTAAAKADATTADVAAAEKSLELADEYVSPPSVLIIENPPPSVIFDEPPPTPSVSPPHQDVEVFIMPESPAPSVSQKLPVKGRLLLKDLIKTVFNKQNANQPTFSAADSRTSEERSLGVGSTDAVACVPMSQAASERMCAPPAAGSYQNSYLESGSAWTPSSSAVATSVYAQQHHELYMGNSHQEVMQVSHPRVQHTAAQQQQQEQQQHHRQLQLQLQQQQQHQLQQQQLQQQQLQQQQLQQQQLQQHQQHHLLQLQQQQLQQQQLQQQQLQQYQQQQELQQRQQQSGEHRWRHLSAEEQRREAAEQRVQRALKVQEARLPQQQATLPAGPYGSPGTSGQWHNLPGPQYSQQHNMLSQHQQQGTQPFYQTSQSQMTEQATAANQLTFRQGSICWEICPPPTPPDGKNTIKTKGKIIVTELELVSLKGHCHEMNNFFEGLKNQSVLLCRRRGFLHFLHLNCLEKYFLSSCLLL
jgi:hypothetical protein